jgi:hypothetical protein
LDLWPQFGSIKPLIEKDYWDEIVSSSTLLEIFGSAVTYSAINFFGVNHHAVREARLQLEEPSSVYLLVHGENCAELFGILEAQ